MHLWIVRRSWEDNIEMDQEGVEWFHRSRDKDQWLALANAHMNLQVS
jgi:hypothetical protein